jgi:hypothetical protein
MSCSFIGDCVKPGVSQVLRNHIIFTDKHHYSHLTTKQTIEKYKNVSKTVLGKCLDIKKMNELDAANDNVLFEAPVVVARRVSKAEAIASLYGPEIMAELRKYVWCP